MKTTDWRWNGSVFGVPVRRHGNWHVRLFGNRLIFRTYSGQPRIHLMIRRLLTVGWWPTDQRRFELRVFGLSVR